MNFMCRWCNRGFSTVLEFKQHNILPHKKYCVFCFLCFTNRSEMIKHYDQCHKKQIQWNVLKTAFYKSREFVI